MISISESIIHGIIYIAIILFGLWVIAWGTIGVIVGYAWITQQIRFCKKG